MYDKLHKLPHNYLFYFKYTIQDEKSIFYFKYNEVWQHY